MKISLSKRLARIVVLSSVAVGFAGLSACADSPPSPVEKISSDGARIVRSQSGALTAPSTEPDDVVVRDFLRDRGLIAPDTLRVLSESAPVDGIVHLRMDQVVDGHRVVGAYVKAALSEHGELLHLIDHSISAKGALTPATIDEQAALDAALRYLGYAVTAPPRLERAGNVTRFQKSSVFYRAPTVERIAYEVAPHRLAEGFMVETWSAKKNLLDHTVVGADGAIVSTQRRTNTESYLVFEEDPGKGDQVSVSPPTTWLSDGSQYTTDITGPNVHAYLDTDNDGAADPATDPVTDGKFLAVADLTVAPSTAANQAVAVQNLFYLNNRAHDVLAGHGFDVDHGNFEGDDPVRAEAQDGGGLDNANFATPPDGSSPRMQMYLWTSPLGNVVVTADGADYVAFLASFGPALDAPVSAPLALYDAANPDSDGCARAARGSLTGVIALVNRGTCNFTDKVLNAQNAGAVGVIVANHNPGEAAFSMGGSQRRIAIPSAMVTYEDGQILRGEVGTEVTLAANPDAVLIDGDLDADIVFHEYGHGLTWRMIGNMDGTIAGAIGEGASDTLAFLLNEDDLVGEYLWEGGIRRYPYEDYPLTYADAIAGEVHDDGEIYAAAMWRVYENYLALPDLTADHVLHDFVQGMNYTPSQPTFEEMRDGMLAAIAAAGGDDAAARSCAIWQGFADTGIGVGASVVVRGPRVTITESFEVPADCL